MQIQSKEMVISDVSGNKMFFDRCFPGAGRLVRTVSCHNDKLAKIYHYNTEGQLDVIYDNRKPNTIIAFDYNQETGLLNTTLVNKIVALDCWSLIFMKHKETTITWYR